MEEIWKDIVGYEGKYQVSNLGRIKSMRRIVPDYRGVKTIKEKILTPKSSSHKYLEIRLYNGDGKQKSFLVHRLVAVAFIQNKENKKQVNHINGRHQDNNSSNLEWTTQSENMKHSFVCLGRNKATKKLSDEQVVNIKRLFNSKLKTKKELSKMYGVSKDAIRFALLKKETPYTY